jgi:hypothetical protein
VVAVAGSALAEAPASLTRSIDLARRLLRLAEAA